MDDLVDNFVNQVNEYRTQMNIKGKSLHMKDLDKEFTHLGVEITEKLFSKLDEVYPSRVSIECSKLVNGTFRIEWSIL